MASHADTPAEMQLLVMLHVIFDPLQLHERRTR